VSLYLPEKSRDEKEEGLEGEDDWCPLVVCDLQVVSDGVAGEVLCQRHVVRVFHPAILVRVLGPLATELGWCPAVYGVSNVLTWWKYQRFAWEYRY